MPAAPAPDSLAPSLPRESPIVCELLGLSARRPTRLTFSLARFAAHGGRLDQHGDGWGVAFFDGPDLRLYREPAPAAESPLVQFLERCGPASELVVSHIRRATRGAVALRNTHPFVRELGGRLHAFAHNGALEGLRERRPLAGHRFRPVGDTDSEHAFCLLLEALAPLWDGGSPPLAARLARVAAFARELCAFGPANFLYADGEFLFAHGDRRRQRDGGIRPPGLWALVRCCREAPDRTEAAGLRVEGDAQQVALLASVPLSDEDWRPLAEGEILVLERGAIVGRRPAGGAAPTGSVPPSSEGGRPS